MSLSSKFNRFKKPSNAVELEREELEREELTHEEVATPKPKKPAAKKAPVVAEDDFDDDMILQDEEDVILQDDEKDVIVPKKSSKKVYLPLVEDEDDGDDEPTPVVAPKPKKSVKKVAKEEVAEEVEVEVEVIQTKKTSKGGGFGKKKNVVEQEEKTLRPGDWMPQEKFIKIFHEKLQEVLGDGAPDTLATTQTVVKTFEALMLQTLEEYDLRWMGQKFSRSSIAERIYAPHSGTLETVKSPYHTRVSSHDRVSLTLSFNKVSKKGTLTPSGNFVEGKFDNGKFIKGEWVGDIFAPKK